MTFSSPEPLNELHQLDNFDCGNFSLNEWLAKYSRQSHSSGSAKTFIISNETNQVLGYFSLTVGQVDTPTVPDRISRGMGRYPIPVIILARLAVSSSFQGRGIGMSLLKDAIRKSLSISEHVGARALLAHPIDEKAEKFYLRFGFEQSPVREKQLLLLLKDARKIINKN